MFPFRCQRFSPFCCQNQYPYIVWICVNGRWPFTAKETNELSTVRLILIFYSYVRTSNLFSSIFLHISVDDIHVNLARYTLLARKCYEMIKTNKRIDVNDYSIFDVQKLGFFLKGAKQYEFLNIRRLRIV